MTSKLNERAILGSIRMLIKDGFGVDYENNSEMKDTPNRVTKYWMELLEGMQYSNDDIVDMFKDKVYQQDIGTRVVVSDIPIFSHCEHHLALMYDIKVSVEYTSTGAVLGLSKINRICELVGKRLQLQERIGSDIAYIIKKLTQGKNIIVKISGKHACVTARGIKSDSVTHTEAHIE